MSRSEPSAAPRPETSDAPGSASALRPWHKAFLGLCVLLILAMTAVQARHEARFQVARNNDVKLYRTVTEHIAAGRVPYRDFDVEYPPTAPYAIGLATGFSPASDDPAYTVRFMAAMGLLASAGLVGLVTIARHLGAGANRTMWAVGVTTFGMLALRSSVTMRYDLIPAVVFAFGLALFVQIWRGADRRGADQGETNQAALIGSGLLIALSTGLKLYGIFPLIGIATLLGTRNRREALLFVGGAGLGLLPSVGLALLGPGGVRYFLDYHGHRHLESGSLYASLMSLLRPGEVAIEFGYGSFEMRHPLERVLLPVATSLVLLTAIVPMIWLVVGNRRSPASVQTILLGTTLSIAGFVLFNKVFSPQYAVWTLVLVPLLALGHGRPGPVAIGALFAIAAACGWQMTGSNFVNPADPRSLTVVAIKNAICLAAYAALVWAFVRSWRPDPAVNPPERAPVQSALV